MDRSFVKDLDFMIRYDLHPKPEQLVLDSFNRTVARFATWPNARAIHADWEDEILQHLEEKGVTLNPKILQEKGMQHIVFTERSRAV